MSLIKVAYDKAKLQKIKSEHVDNRGHWRRAQGKYLGWIGGHMAGSVIGNAAAHIHPTAGLTGTAAWLGLAAAGVHADRARKVRDFENPYMRKQFSK